MMKKRAFLRGFLLAFVLLFVRFEAANAVAEPQAIRWNAPPGDFVVSLYQGVLGRPPTSTVDLQTVNALAQELASRRTTRYQLFNRFLGSAEYRASVWAQQKKDYFVFWEPFKARRNDGHIYNCRCYYYGKFGTGFMPSYQYTLIPYSGGPYTFSVASALTKLYAGADRDTCPDPNCWGWGSPDEQIEQTVVPPGGGGGSSGGGAFETCRDKTCPQCANAINLLGESTSRECQDCINWNRQTIERCAQGSSVAHGGPCTDIVGRWRHRSGVEIEFSRNGDEFHGRLAQSVSSLDQRGFVVGEVINWVVWEPGSACSYSGRTKQYRAPGSSYFLDETYSVSGNQMTISNAQARGRWTKVR